MNLCCDSRGKRLYRLDDWFVVKSHTNTNTCICRGVDGSKCRQFVIRMPNVNSVATDLRYKLHRLTRVLDARSKLMEFGVRLSATEISRRMGERKTGRRQQDFTEGKLKFKCLQFNFRLLQFVRWTRGNTRDTCIAKGRETPRFNRSFALWIIYF